MDIDREPRRGIDDGLSRAAATDQRGGCGCRRQLLRGAITQARAANGAACESQTTVGAFASAFARAYRATSLKRLSRSPTDLKVKSRELLPEFFNRISPFS